MAEIIDLAEVQAQRRKNRARAPQREHLEHAVEVLKANLAAAANLLVEAPATEQNELLTRVERLSAMIRYGMRMLGESADSGLDPARAGDTR